MKAKIYKVKAYTNEIIRGKFAKVKDLRVSGMVEHPLVDLLIIIMLSIVSGVEKLDEIVTYGKKKRGFLRQVFGIEKTPSKSTISRVLNMIEGEEVVEIIIEIMKMKILRLGDVIAVDGKAIRSTAEKGKPKTALQILTAYFVESGVVLGQKYIHEKTNEIPVFQEMLCYINIKGKTITADAMHCQKDTCRMIIAKGGNYVIGLKGNQKSFYKQVEMFFNDADNAGKIEVFEAPAEKHNGRCEQRIFYRANTDVSYFNFNEEWFDLKSVFAVRRIVETKYGVTDETGYYISNLDRTPEQMLALVRSHWKIESMHWLLDVVFSEDDCRILSDNGQKTLDIFRKFALLLHKTFIAENNLKCSLKNNMLSCLLDDDFLLQVCS